MRKNISLDTLKRLEQYLASKLQPIKPNPGFIHKLQTQLGNAKNVFIEKKTQTVTYLFIIFGIITGAVFLMLLGKPRSRKKAGS